jgi:hypothetical protein
MSVENKEKEKPVNIVELVFKGEQDTEAFNKQVHKIDKEVFRLIPTTFSLDKMVKMCMAAIQEDETFQYPKEFRKNTAKLCEIVDFLTDDVDAILGQIEFDVSKMSPKDFTKDPMILTQDKESHYPGAEQKAALRGEKYNVYVRDLEEEKAPKSFACPFCDANLEHCNRMITIQHTDKSQRANRTVMLPYAGLHLMRQHKYLIRTSEGWRSDFSSLRRLFGYKDYTALIKAHAPTEASASSSS